MSLQIANLTTGVPPESDRGMTLSTLGNRIPVSSDAKVYDLYVAPVTSATTSAKAAISKSIRITNTSGAPVKINVFFAYTSNESGASRVVRRQISPLDVILPTGFVYIDETEVTLPPGSRIQANAKPDSATPPNPFIDFVISGVERDAT